MDAAMIERVVNAARAFVWARDRMDIELDDDEVEAGEHFGKTIRAFREAVDELSVSVHELEAALESST